MPKPEIKVGDAVKWKRDGAIKEVCTVISIRYGFAEVESKVCGGRFSDYLNKFEPA